MSLNMVVTRRAVLIGCPGEGQNFLKGVQQDLYDMKEFLSSERGGKFYPDEIVSLFNPTLDEVTAAIHSTAADYMYVYFSGHGYTDEQNRRMVSLKDYSISDLHLLNGSSRQLVIVDACRNYISANRIGAIQGLSDECDHFEGSPVRDLFNEWILLSPAGHMIIHATANGTISYDTDKGGVFSQTLLSISTNFIINEGYTPVSAYVVLGNVKNAMRLNGRAQVPCIVYNTGNLTVPFAVGKAKQVPVYYPQQIAQVQESSNSSWVGLVLLGLIFIGIAMGE